MQPAAPAPQDATRPPQSLVEYFAKVALLAAIYFLTGKLGLSLAVPPGYATVIWPPSGIALGALLAHGRRLAPGVFLGSFLLNCELAQAWSAAGLLPDRVLLAASIAAGSTLQAVVGQLLVQRWLGVPLRLRRVSQVFRLFAVAGPLACLVAASVGVGSLVLSGDVARAEVAHNWISWWAGDVFGIVVFLPLVLVLPGGAAVLTWRDRAVRDLHAIGLTLLVLPLGVTFYSWKYFADSAHRQSQVHFETLARESEQAIVTRLAAYASATRSGAGMLQSSQHVSRREWQTFAEAIRIRDDFPGMLGLGWIEHVPAQSRASYLERVRADDAPHFRIHPEADGGALDIVTYIEPEIANGALIGLNLGAEPRSGEAAARAAETGLPTLTRAVPLVEDEQTAPGFLLLQAVYRGDLPLDNAELRRKALRGYVYAPFLARSFVAGTTPSQGRSFDISILDGGADATVVHSSRITNAVPGFEVRREVVLYGQPWTLVWQSTLEFEQAEYSNSGLFVLFGGLLFTGLFAVLLVVLGARRKPAQLRAPPERPRVLPIATAALIAGGSVAAYLLLSNAENSQLSSLVEEETRRIESSLDRATRQQLQALRRMAHRWTSGGGTSYVVWRNDARDFVRQIDGLEELQWIGPDYRVQWAEGGRRSAWLENRDIRTNEKLARDLADSAERGAPLVTEPREIAAGESGFTVYIPLLKEGRFDGFLAALFSSRGFFSESLGAAASSAVAFSVKYADVTYFDNGRTAAADPAWTRESGFRFNDKRWTFLVTPTQQFIDARQTLLPTIVLLSGLLIAGLSGILVRYVLVARAKAARLRASARALSESEQRYALALRGMSVGLWDWDIESNSLYWSDKFKEILGVQPGQLASHYSDFAQRVHPDDHATVSAALNRHLKGGAPYDLEFRMRREDGEHIWVHVYGQAQFDDGVAVRMAGSLQDITHERQQQQALRRWEAKLRLLIENTPAAVAMFDKEMRYILTSRRWLQDYGLEGRDIIGMSHYDVFPEIRSMPRWVEIHQRALRGEKFDMHEDCWVRANGRQEWHQWALHPWFEGDEVQGLVLFTENITGRKQADAALRTSEAMVRAAMDKAPIGKALVQPNGAFLKVNPALCRMLGYSEEELLAADFQAITHPEDLAEDLANVRALLDGKVVSYQMEKRYLHRDGRVIWAELSVSLVRRANGEPDFFVSQIQDISERKAIDRIKDEFVSVISHEVCAPLTVIRESLNMIAAMRGVELPTPVRRLFEASRGSCDRLATLVNDIHDLDRIAAGRLPLEFRDESIAYIARQAVEAGEFHARKHDVNITLAPIDPAIIVYVDPGRLLQALTNLLSNAAKFSPPGSEVQVGAELHGDSVRLLVRDRGEGIPEEFRARIFGRFAQAGSRVAHQRAGTGLGLHLARELVEQMRGNIGFVTQVGAGSTFWVEFPIVSRAVPAAALC